MSDEWGPWIEHDGLGCPVPSGTWVQVIGVGPEVWQVVTDEDWAEAYSVWDWSLFGTTDDDGRIWGNIIRYRVRKPRGLTILEQIAADPPKAPFRKPVKVPA